MDHQQILQSTLTAVYNQASAILQDLVNHKMDNRWKGKDCNLIIHIDFLSVQEQNKLYCMMDPNHLGGGGWMLSMGNVLRKHLPYDTRLLDILQTLG